MNDNFIFDVKLSNQDGAVKAYADFTIVTEKGEITISGFKVIQKDEREPFVVMPTVSFKIDGGGYKNVEKISASRLFENFAKEFILGQYASLK